MFNLTEKGKSMDHVTTVGIDLAKNVFSLHGVNARGREVLRRAGRAAGGHPAPGSHVAPGAQCPRTARLSPACVAIAAKNARIAWAMLVKDEPLRTATA
jgi:hypothetical protein